MAWDKQTKKFLGIALIAAIVVAALFVADEGFLRNAGQGIIDWACGLMGITAPTIF